MSRTQSGFHCQLVTFAFCGHDAAERRRGLTFGLRAIKSEIVAVNGASCCFRGSL